MGVTYRVALHLLDAPGINSPILGEICCFEYVWIMGAFTRADKEPHVYKISELNPRDDNVIDQRAFLWMTTYLDRIFQG